MSIMQVGKLSCQKASKLPSIIWSVILEARPDSQAPCFPTPSLVGLSNILKILILIWDT